MLHFLTSANPAIQLVLKILEQAPQFLTVDRAAEISKTWPEPNGPSVRAVQDQIRALKKRVTATTPATPIKGSRSPEKPGILDFISRTTKPASRSVICMHLEMMLLQLCKLSAVKEALRIFLSI